MMMMRASYSMFFFILCFALSHHQVTSNNQHEDNSKVTSNNQHEDNSKEGYTLELNPAYPSSRVIPFPGSISASKQPQRDHHSHSEKLHHHHHHHHVYYVEKASGYFPIMATSSYGQHRRRHKRSHHQAQILKVQFPSKSLGVTYPALYEHNHHHKRPRHHVSIPMKGPQFSSESAVATPNRKKSRRRRHLYHYQHHRHHHHHHHRHQHKHKQSQHKHHSPSPGRLHNFS